jgi:hypothetical protein
MIWSLKKYENKSEVFGILDIFFVYFNVRVIGLKMMLNIRQCQWMFTSPLMQVQICNLSCWLYQAFAEESHQHGSDTGHVEDHSKSVLKGLVGLLAVYLFFVMERLVTLFTNSKRKQKKVRQSFCRLSLLHEIWVTFSTVWIRFLCPKMLFNFGFDYLCLQVEEVY